jgi:hypothetical protein
MEIQDMFFDALENTQFQQKHYILIIILLRRFNFIRGDHEFGGVEIKR